MERKVPRFKLPEELNNLLRVKIYTAGGSTYRQSGSFAVVGSVFHVSAELRNRVVSSTVVHDLAATPVEHFELPKVRSESETATRRATDPRSLLGPRARSRWLSFGFNIYLHSPSHGLIVCIIPFQQCRLVCRWFLGKFTVVCITICAISLSRWLTG